MPDPDPDFTLPYTAPTTSRPDWVDGKRAFQKKKETTMEMEQYWERIASAVERMAEAAERQADAVVGLHTHNDVRKARQHNGAGLNDENNA